MHLSRPVDLVVVVVCFTHGESPAALLRAADSDNVLERMATAPLTLVASTVAFHFVTL
jgi:hypothetical protein